MQFSTSCVKAAGIRSNFSRTKSQEIVQGVGKRLLMTEKIMAVDNGVPPHLPILEIFAQNLKDQKTGFTDTILPDLLAKFVLRWRRGYLADLTSFMEIAYHGCNSSSVIRTRTIYDTGNTRKFIRRP